MGEVIAFSDLLAQPRTGRTTEARNEPATVIILPVIRIDRCLEEPSNGLEPDSGNSTGRRRRRRASR